MARELTNETEMDRILREQREVAEELRAARAPQRGIWKAIKEVCDCCKSIQ